MSPAFAALHDADHPPGDEDLGRLAAALGEEAAAAGGRHPAPEPVATTHLGPLAIAWSGGDTYAPRPGEHVPLVHVHGAIYNLDDLLHGEATTGPARAVAELHRRHGLGMLRLLRGDFVLVIHEPEAARTSIVRDHLGGRGAVWHRIGSRLFLAAEIATLLAVLPRRPEPDPAALAHWLGWSGMPGDRTLYGSIHRIPAAHLLRVGAGPTAGPPAALRYWQPVYQRPSRWTVPDAAAELRERLTKAVARRATGHPGVLLSGGLDSSSVAALAGTLATDLRPATAYSAVFPRHPTIDESSLIHQVCERAGLRSVRVVVRSGSVLSGAAEYLRRWRLPPSSPNLFFWLPLLRRAAADGVGALLDGEGGDELFGLSPYLMADRLRRGRVLAAAGLVRRFPGGGPHIGWSRIRPVLIEYGVKGAVPARMQQVVRRARGGARYVPPWLRPATVAAYLGSDDTGAWKAVGGPRWWAFLVETVTRGMGPSLTYDHVRRRATMCGLDARHPLVDVDVVEFVLGLPPELAYDTRWSRPVLRGATEGLLPDEVRLRFSKSLFDALFHESLAGPDLPAVRALLGRPDAAVAPYVDLGRVRAELLAGPPPPERAQWWAMGLWRLVTAECWLRNLEGEPIPELDDLVPADLEVVPA